MSNLLRYDDSKVITFIDCETFNLNLSFTCNRPWQISMIKTVGGKIIDQRDIFIKWSDTDLKIGKEAARITRFNQNKFDRKAISSEEAYPLVNEWLENCDYICGHNIFGFDLYLLRGFYKFFKKDWKWITKKVLDTNTIARGIKMDIPFQQGQDITEYQYRIYHTKNAKIKSRLVLLGKEFDIKFDEKKLHDAIEDLKLNVAVWNKLKWQIEL